jgi:Zn-dependent protease with chaperone function
MKPSPSRPDRWILPVLVATLLASDTAFAAIPIPADSARAIAIGHTLDLYWIAGKLLALLVPAGFLFSGLGARIARACDRMTRGNRYASLTLFACFYLLLGALPHLPLDDARRHALAAARGVALANRGEWLAGQAAALVAPMMAAILFLWIPYALIKRSPRRWWLWSTAALVPAVLFVIVLQPVWMGALTTSYAPLADKALETEIKALAARCGIDDIPVVVGGGDTTVVGLGPTNRVVLQHDLAATENPAQIRFTIAHELKHYVMGDNWKAVLIASLLLLAGFWIAHRLGHWLIRQRLRCIGFDQLGDPASLPLIVLCMTGLWLAVTPAFLAFDRHIEREADRFGFELTHENEAAAKLFASWVGDNELAEPGWFERNFRDTHPSAGERIRMANDYRPWLKGSPLKYGHECEM